MQLQVHLHNRPLSATTSPRSMSCVPPPSIALLTNIRFLNGLRSTASPVLSHFHTLLCLTLQLQRLDSIPVGHSICTLNASISNSLQNIRFPFISSFLCDLGLCAYSCLVTCRRTGREAEWSASRPVYCTQKLPLWGNLPFFSVRARITNWAAILVLESRFMKLDVCVMRQGSLRIKKTPRQRYVPVM